MSDLDLSMYGVEDFDPVQYGIDVNVPVHVSRSGLGLVSQQTVSISKLGRTSRVEIDGKEFFIIDPIYVQNLARRLEASEAAQRELATRLQRTTSALSVLTNRVEELSRSLGRITGNE